MTMKQTCCPFCHSAFYVTTLQLNAYKGQARCGQCHQVFDALANLIVKNPPPASPASEDSTDAIHVVAEPDVQATANLAQATDEAHTVVLPQNFRKPVTAPVATPPAAAPDAEEDDLLFSDEHGIDDEADTSAASVATNGASSSLLLDDTFDQQFLNGGIEPKDDLFDKQANQVEKLHHAADDSWIEDLLKEEEAEVKKTEQQAREAAHPHKKTYQTNESATSNAESFSEPKRPAYISDHEEDLLSYLNRTGVTRSQAPDPLISIAEQKPASHRILQPSTKTYPSNYVYSWLFMIGLMLCLLFAQFVYFNFEELAINPKTAGKVEKVCKLFRCNIPYMNADQIKLRNLRVIASAKGETTFKATLVNTAKMSQPFPALKLSLKRNGKIVASQTVQPRQYLSEEQKLMTRLATKQLYPIEFTVKKERADIGDFSLEPSFR